MGFQLRGPLRQFLFKDGKMCVPESLAGTLVRQWHEPALGHAGIQKMISDLKSRFVIPDLGNLVKMVRHGCQLCQACDKPNWSGPGRWQSTPIPDRPMAHIALDIVAMRPDSTFDGRHVDSAMVVVDRLTGWVCAWPIFKKGFTAKLAALMVHHYWFDILGVPTTVTSDLGPHFNATWWKTLCALKGIHHASAISYRPSSNG